MSINHKGLFITVEGGEGAGKSTSLETIRAFLVDKNIEAVFTREPGGTPAGEAMRSILKGREYEGLDPVSELLLMFAARREHIEQVIKPALESGKWVVSDRFTDASYAYQGGGRGVCFENIALLEQLVQEDLRPDYTLLLDISVEAGFERVVKRGEFDRFEIEQKAFFERVRKVYLERAKAEPQRFIVVDAGNNIDQVRQQIMNQLNKLFDDLSSNGRFS